MTASADCSSADPLPHPGSALEPTTALQDQVSQLERRVERAEFLLHLCVQTVALIVTQSKGPKT